MTYLTDIVNNYISIIDISIALYILINNPDISLSKIIFILYMNYKYIIRELYINHNRLYNIFILF